MRLAIQGAILGAAIFAIAAPVAVQAQDIRVGPGGVDVERHRDRDCRVIIDHHVNERGDRVTVRRRVCD